MPVDVEGTDVPVEEPRRRRRGKAMPLEEMQSRYPSLKLLSQPPGKASRYAWVAAFTARPDAMHALLADLIKQVYAQPGRIGQRPMPEEESVDFYGLMGSEQNDRPLTEVLPRLVHTDQRTFCQRIFMSRTQFQRLLKGEYEPDVHELRAIADAVKKPPTFFVEYRKAMAIAAFVNLIDERPGIATSLYRRYLEVRMGK